jgi:hypothetical protein
MHYTNSRRRRLKTRPDFCPLTKIRPHQLCVLCELERSGREIIFFLAFQLSRLPAFYTERHN